MKKILSVTILLLAFVLGGCTSNQATINNATSPNRENFVNLSNEQSLALSTYLASGLLTTSNANSNMSYNLNSSYKLAYLTASTEEVELAIETELDDVNVYFNQLKALIDSGIESALTINEQVSTIEGYDTQITYSIEDVTYTIYYTFVEELPADTDEDVVNTSSSEATEEEDDDDEDKDEDEQEFKLVGLMVIDGVSYELIGSNEMEGSESKMWFETTDVNNTGNFVKVEIKNENNEQKFELHSLIDGNEQIAEIKFESEENETKAELELTKNGVESSYEFKKEVEDGETVYKFEYEIDGVEGEVKIIETLDENGNVVYTYKIKEEGKEKEIDKEKEHGRDQSDDEDEDEEETETESD
jgi:hypothetical protein